MKYINLFIVIIFTCIFIISPNVYAKEQNKDLTLSRIYVEPGNLEPEFSETRDYYTLILNNDVTNLIVQATPTNQNLKYEIKGNENLKEGENIITITIYSEDNSKSKVYTINALKTNEPDKYNALLSTLIIDNYPFNEEFFPERFNYTLKDDLKDRSIEVFAYPQNSNAKVEINGNTNLNINDNNVINITVTSENGLSSRTYMINTKSISIPSLDSNFEDIINTNTNNNLKEFKIFLIISIIIFSILIMAIYVFRNK